MRSEGDEESDWTHFNFQGGLKEFVEWTNQGKEALHKPFYITKEVSNLTVLLLLIITNKVLYTG